MKNRLYLLIVFIAFLSGCSEPEKEQSTITKPVAKPTETKPEVKLVEAPAFDAQSAYKFIENQVEFGPRIPNTEAHKKCADYLVGELANFGLDTAVQRAKVTAYNGKELSIFNITGSYKPSAASRIILCAHWDSRPFADRDTKKRAKAFDAANDGASGVGVMLELARAISESNIKPETGIDFIFFDAEDYGQPQESMHAQQGDTWCLGAQYWANNLPQGYKPNYAILLDMVGAANAQFPKEGYSMYYAPMQTNNIWSIAKELGYGNYFVEKQMMGGLTDDHKYVNEIAHIPCLDIIHYDTQRNDFGKFHHTHKDNMSIIDTTTLKAVGETVMQVIYKE